MHWRLKFSGDGGNQLMGCFHTIEKTTHNFQTPSDLTAFEQHPYVSKGSSEQTSSVFCLHLHLYTHQWQIRSESSILMKMRNNFSCICCTMHFKLHFCYCLHKRSLGDLLHLCTVIILTIMIDTQIFFSSQGQSFMWVWLPELLAQGKGTYSLPFCFNFRSCLNVAAARNWEAWKQVWREKAESSALSFTKAHTFMVNNKLDRKVARNTNRVSAQVNFCWLRVHTIYPRCPELPDQI